MTDLDAIRKRLSACPIPDGSNTDGGKRLGAVLDYACAYHRDVAALLAEVERLKSNG